MTQPDTSYSAGNCAAVACGQLETAILLAERLRATNPGARSIREALIADLGNAHALTRRAYLQMLNLAE